MTGDLVRVVYTKYDGSLHWHQEMTRLGEDEHGVWLGAPSGTVSRRGHDGPRVVNEKPHVLLVRTDAWWTAAFYADHATLEIYCDITGPVRWPQPDEVTMVDLDLDVTRLRADGRVELWDEDEFAEHQVRYVYPVEVIDRASRTAAWLHTALGDGSEPFASVYRSWLSRVD